MRHPEPERNGQETVLRAQRLDLSAPSRGQIAKPRVFLALPQSRDFLAGFDGRVLHEAQDGSNPLLERVKSSPSPPESRRVLHEAHRRPQAAGARRLQEKTVDGRTPQEQIAECLTGVADLERRQRIVRAAAGRAARAGIEIVGYGDLDDDARQAARHYVNNVFPLVTPLALDPAHPFPFISNLSLNLLVTGHHPKDTDP